MAVVARVGADVGRDREHVLGAVRAHAREDVKEDVLAEEIAQVGGEIVRGRGAEGDGEGVLGDGEGGAAAGELAGVHVGVDPGGGADAIGVATDREEPEVAALGVRARLWRRTTSGRLRTRRGAGR
ncbi:MAG: hypothetical protein R3F14_40855 [Polyangiaceae bacterium]